MEGSVGQALRNARLQQKLTIEEVARGTKIRPARVVDLENDDYMHFPNLAYARSFLVLYAKFLRVDITKYPTVDVGSAVGTGDYQYLRGEETEVPARRHHHEPAGPPEKPRWLIAFFVFLVMVGLGIVAGFFFMQFMRLGSVETLVKKDVEVYKAPAVSPTPATAQTPEPAPSAAPTVSPGGEPVAVAVPVAPGEPEATPVLPAEPVGPPNTLPIPEVTPEIRKAESLSTGTTDAEILAQAAAAAAAAPSATPETTPAVAPEGPEREIKIRTTRKTKIRLVRENPAGAPSNTSLYLGFINPLQPPVSFKGRHFWIKTSDPDALKITVDGKPVTPGPDSGVEIQ